MHTRASYLHLPGYVDRQGVLLSHHQELSSVMDGFCLNKESGVPKDKAKYKVVLVHGFNNSKDMYLPLSQEAMEELGVCVVAYDGAGYGEVDPNPGRSVKSEAFDIQELADQLHLGSKFYVIGASMGTYPVWALLKYIPHRVAGAALVSPVINFWWPSFPPKFARKMYRTQLKRDQVKYWIAHNVLGLHYWWMTQKWFPYCGVLQRYPYIMEPDAATLAKMVQLPTRASTWHKLQQQGEYLSLHLDCIILSGKWEFDPMEMENPFPENEGSVYMFQGLSDTLFPLELHRHVAKKLPWIRYHEVPGAGHMMIHESPICASIFRQLLLGEEPNFI